LTPWSLALIFAAGTRVLVMPFENLSDDAAQDWKGSAFEEAISSHLESVGYEIVDVESRNRHFVNHGFDPVQPVTRATAIVLARELGADRLVVGNFRPGEDQLEASARVIDLAEGVTIGIVDDFAKPDDLTHLANQLAKNIFRLERDEAPAAFDESAGKRATLAPAAIEASARARVNVERDEQLQYLEQAIALEPSYLEARVLLGQLLLEEGRPRDAIDILVAAKDSGSVDPKAYFELGVAYLSVEEPTAAHEIFRNLAMREDGRSAAAHNNLGVTAMRLGLLDEALEAFQCAVDRGGDVTDYWFNLGFASWRAGKGSRALELFQRVVEARPLDGEAYFMLAAAAASQAEPEKAERMRATALLLSPQLEDVDAGTVEGWERVALEERMSLDSSPTVELDGEDVTDLAEILDAREYRARGRYDDAVQLLQKSLYREPSANEIRRELASVLREAGDLEQAATELAIALWNEPTSDAYVELAEIYRDLDEPDKAREQLELALELEPGHSGALALRDTLSAAAPH
jgi:tetratricopeptide (TPR) repeat protein